MTDSVYFLEPEYLMLPTYFENVLFNFKIKFLAVVVVIIISQMYHYAWAACLCQAQRINDHDLTQGKPQ